MNILFLTDKTRQANGYAVVGENLRRSLEHDWGCQVDCFSTDEYRRFCLSATTLKSTLFQKYGLLVVGWDLLVLLWCTRGRRYDVIHCNVEHFALLACIYGWVRGIPFTITAHGTYGVLLPCRYALFARAFRRAACIFAVSRYTRRRMLEEGVEAVIEVVPNGVDLQRFHADSQIVKLPQLLFVGNDKPRKGFSFLYDSLLALTKNGVKPRLVVAGSFGSSKADVEDRANKDGVDVQFVGKVSEAELLRFYQESALNVLPSRSDPHYFEGFGLIHAEAIAAGTLTIGCKDSGNEDAIAEGNGWLVHHGDIAALSLLIESVLLKKNADEWSPKGPKPLDWKNIAKIYLNRFRLLARD